MIREYKGPLKRSPAEVSFFERPGGFTECEKLLPQWDAEEEE